MNCAGKLLLRSSMFVRRKALFRKVSCLTKAPEKKRSLQFDVRVSSNSIPVSVLVCTTQFRLDIN